MRDEEAKILIDKLREAAMPHPGYIPIEKAKRVIGLRKYRKLCKGWGPGKRGPGAWIAEKGAYLHIFSEVMKSVESARESLTPPTMGELERIRKLEKFSDISLFLSIVLAIIFFFIGDVPLCFICKIGLMSLIITIMWFLNHKLFSFLEEIK